MILPKKEALKKLTGYSLLQLEGESKYVATGNLATLLNAEGKWLEALDIHRECFEFFKSKDAKSQMATAISQQAQIYQDQGKYEQALNLD